MADHQDSAVKHDDHLLLDQHLLRMPYELLRKNFRSAHWVVDRESVAVRAQLRDSCAASLAGQASIADTAASLDAMVARLQTLRGRVQALAGEETQLHRQLERRTDYLRELFSIDSVDDLAFVGWSRRRLVRLVVDYMLRRGYCDSARALAASCNMDDLVDTDSFLTMARIISGLRGGNVQEALIWVHEKRKELKRLDNNLEFMLRYQQYIELVRAQSFPRFLDAVAYAKKYLAPFEPSWPQEVQQACGLLALPSAITNISIFGPQRWDMLVDSFIAAYNTVLSLPQVPLLHIALTAGLSALKTPSCLCARDAIAKDRVRDANMSAFVLPFPPDSVAADMPLLPVYPIPGKSFCPICSIELNELARHVPWAHHTKSYVDPDQLLLPNGRAYGRARLITFAQKAGIPQGKTMDPCTGEVFDSKGLRKVFVT